MMNSETICRQLAKVAPFQVRAYEPGGEQRLIGVPTDMRKKWAHVFDTVNSRPWVRMELLDRNGAIVGEILGEETTSVVTRQLVQAPEAAAPPWLGSLILQAQEIVLTFRDKETRVLMESMGAMMQAQTAATRELVQLYKAQREVAAELGARKAELEQGTTLDQIGELLKSAPEVAEGVAKILETFGFRKAAPGN